MIPGIVKTYSYAMTPYIMSEHPSLTANEAITESRRIIDVYKRQEVSNTTKKETKHGSWNECSENTERAVIIEKNPEALLQRVRLIKNAKKEIILSTFAFQSDDSGKLILGALHDAADRGVHLSLIHI